METILTICYTLLFILLIYRMKFFETEGLSKKILSIILIFKISAGIILYLIYTYYYRDRSTADIFKYFDDSRIMFDALLHKPIDYFKMIFSIGNDNPYFEEKYYKLMNNWYRVYESNIYNDSHTIIRFNAIVRIFSFGYYNVHTVFMCFISLCGLTALYKFFVPHFPDKKKELVIAVFFLPSVMLWSSGVLKEGLLLFGLGILIISVDRIMEGRASIMAYLWALFSIVLLFYTKFYVLVCILPLMISYFWVKLSDYRFIEMKYLGVIFIYGLLGLNIHHFIPGYNVLEIITLKQHDFIKLSEAVNSGSRISIPELGPNLGSILTNAPQAFYNTLTRPWFFESSSPLILMAGLENLLYLVAVFLAVVFMKRKVLNRNLAYFTLTFVIFTFTLTGLITPVMGAIVRYKVPAIPFMMVFLLLISDKEKLVSQIKNFKKVKNE